MQAKQPDGSTWHRGEIEVQRRANIGHVSDAGIRSSIPEAAARFLAAQRFAVFGSTDRNGQVWASLRLGEPGFLRAIDPHSVVTAPFGLEGEPLLDNLRTNPDVGLLIIDFATRRRMRVNGEAKVRADASLLIDARQVYGNCPQYIQERAPEGEVAAEDSYRFVAQASELNSDQQAWIRSCDTFFVASAHPQYGADASHRGGNPGFVHVAGSRRLVIPDYSGNRMFNTLGNIYVNPRAGLLFPDFGRGRTLQLSGCATIDWDADREDFPGAQRLLTFDVEHVIEIEQPGLRRYHLQSYSPLNPKLAG
jgi:predicted pyridoxine 5'-phosphate oxidase superfamily flavin-nucleotide-binding protein